MVFYTNCNKNHLVIDEKLLQQASSICNSNTPVINAATRVAVGVSYLEDVKPKVFQPVCAECHGTIPGLPNWLDYNQALAKKDIIKYRVVNKIMPPPQAKINSLTPEQIDLITAWVDSGAAYSSGAVAGGSTGGNTTGPDCQPSDTVGGNTLGPIEIPPPIAPPDPPPPDNPTYTEHVKPMIFAPICGSCHGVRPDLPNWQIYAEAVDRADKIKKKVSEGEMPPPLFWN